MLAIWSLVPLPFLKPAWASGSSQFTYCWSLTWRMLSITLLACEMSAIVPQFEHFLALPFFGIGVKTDLFQACGHFWVFQICWHIECSTFTALFLVFEIDQYFGHLMQRTDSFEKTLMLGKIEGQRRRGWQRMRWLDSITDLMDMGLDGLQMLVMDGGPGMLRFMGLQRVRHDWVTELNWTE